MARTRVPAIASWVPMVIVAAVAALPDQLIGYGLVIALIGAIFVWNSHDTGPRYVVWLAIAGAVIYYLTRQLYNGFGSGTWTLPVTVGVAIVIMIALAMRWRNGSPFERRG